MTWQPQPEGLATIADLLVGGHSLDNEVQRHVQQEMHNLATNLPEFPCYLATILAGTSGHPAHLRTVAGYALKSYLINYLRVVQPAVLQYVKHAVLSVLGDRDDDVNKVAGTLISFLLSQVRIDGWPEALARLCDLLADPAHPAFNAALSTVHKVCEDDSDDLILSPKQPLATLLPRLTALVPSPNERVAVDAIRSISELVHGETHVVDRGIDAFLPSLFSRAMEPSAELRKAVCYCLVKILEFRPDKLEAQLDDIIAYMITCTQNADLAIALEACEFWLVIAEHPDYADTLAQYLPQLVPTLLSRMVYSAEELEELGGDEDDAHVPDADQDLKPRHYRGKSHDASSGSSAPRDPNAAAAESDESDLDMDDDDDEDDAVNQWTLRKCSAAALDTLANVYGPAILETLLPLLHERLSSKDWLVRESGILALGATAEGCMEGIAVHLPQLVPYLLNMLQDRPLVRSITAWALGRFANWIIYEGSSFLPQFVEGLLANCKHGNKKVQEASCSGLATLEEAAGPNIAPYIPAILPTLITCFQHYQRRNMLVLYDCTSTLAEAVGGELNRPEYINVLVPVLMGQWNALSDENETLLALFECLASVAIALGIGFSPQAKGVVERCIRIIQKTYVAIEEHAKNPAQVPEPNRDYYIVSLDLIAGVVQGLGASSESLVQMYQHDLMTCLKLTLEDPLPAVKQSALGMFGDLVVNSFIHVRPYAHDFLAVAINYIQSSDEQSWLRLSNNAVWVCAELTDRLGLEMQRVAPALWDRILAILCNRHGREPPAMLAENCALAAGRLGNIAPELLAKDLNRFGGVWATQMINTRDGPEKEASFLGFLKIIQANPAGLVPVLPVFLDALVHYQVVAPQTEEQFVGVANAYKDMCGPQQWERIIAAVPQASQQALRQRFRV
ncbi:hypothetical protein H9P43_006154 [Blastocladiella emersonii ATCC 22665]|nr:hypothetical protein H9P43_006154 [Blastocladiella emersonii ATCC 22665]